MLETCGRALAAAALESKWTSYSRQVEKAYCLSPYEGPPQRKPVLAGSSPHEDLHRTTVACRARPAAEHIWQESDE